MCVRELSARVCICICIVVTTNRAQQSIMLGSSPTKLYVHVTICSPTKILILHKKSRKICLHLQKLLCVKIVHPPWKVLITPVLKIANSKTIIFILYKLLCTYEKSKNVGGLEYMYICLIELVHFHRTYPIDQLHWFPSQISPKNSFILPIKCWSAGFWKGSPRAFLS